METEKGGGTLKIWRSRAPSLYAILVLRVGVDFHLGMSVVREKKKCDRESMVAGKRKKSVVPLTCVRFLKKPFSRRDF